ncbi:MAG: 3-methyl-2-oxobutanoate hydroxymethyltransferase, partial [Acidobacteria bacterium]|nr:3-methyl-2-oxobutanoate hydroxymethyltransferase [Acidobacteriota bacterium]
YDMLGLLESVPAFVKKYANLSNCITEGVRNYVRDVREGRFPHER